MTALALAEEANVEHTQTLLRTARTLREEAGRLEQLAASLRQTANTIENRAAGENVTMIHGREIIHRLQEIIDVDDEIHYRDAVEQLLARGYRPAGIAPDATLLAALHRSPEFEAAESRSGRYRRVV